MGLYERTLKSVLWSAARYGGGRGMSFVIFLCLARLLEPDAFGLVAMATVFVAFAQIFRDQGFTEVVVQREKLDSEHLDTAFWSSVFMGATITVAGVAGAGWVAAAFQQPGLAPVIRWMSLSFLIGGLSSTQEAVLRRQLAFKSLTARSLVAVALSGIVGVSMAVFGCGVWSLVGQVLVRDFVGALLLWQVSDWRPGFAFSLRHFREMLPYGASIVGHEILHFLSRRSDDLLIGLFLGPVTLGYYVVAYRLISTLVGLFVGITQSVAFPVFARVQHDWERMRRGYYAATRMTALITVPTFTLISLLAGEMVVGLYGPQWGPSAPVLRILAWVGILQSLAYYHSVLKACGKPLWRMGLTLVHTLCAIIGFAVTVQWGITAVAMSYVIISYLLAPLPFVAMRRLIRIDTGTYLRQLWAPVLSTACMAVFIYAIRAAVEDNIGLHPLLLLYIVGGAIIYVGAINLTCPSYARQATKLARLTFSRAKSI